jgi:hypothetical protein
VSTVCSVVKARSSAQELPAPRVWQMRADKPTRYYSPSLARPSLHYSSPPQHSFLFFASLHTQTHHTRVFIFPLLEKWKRDGSNTKSQRKNYTRLKALSHNTLCDSDFRISWWKAGRLLILWDTTSCSLQESYQCFGGISCLYLQGTRVTRMRKGCPSLLQGKCGDKYVPGPAPGTGGRATRIQYVWRSSTLRKEAENFPTTLYHQNISAS